MARWNILRLLVIALMTLMLGLRTQGIPTTLAAGEPSNDNPAFAVVVGNLPYHTAQDTTEAVMDQGGTSPTVSCVASYAQPVWYTYTPNFTGEITVDTIGSGPRGTISDYAEFQDAFTGSSTGAEIPNSCNTSLGGGSMDTRATFHVDSGVPVYLLFGTQGAAAPAGNLVINIVAHELLHVANGGTFTGINGTPVTQTFMGNALNGVYLGTFQDANPDCALSKYTVHPISIDWGTPNVTGSNPDTTSGWVAASKVNTNKCYFDVFGQTTFKAPGTYAVVTTVTDDLGNTVTLNATAVIADAPLTADPNGQTVIHPVEGQQFSGVIGQFHSGDLLCLELSGDYKATVNWGDGTPVDDTTGSNVTISGPDGSCNFTVSGTHIFPEEAASYAMTITVVHIADPVTHGPLAGGSTVTINSLAKPVDDADLSQVTTYNPTATEGAPIVKALLGTFHDSALTGGSTFCDVKDYTATIEWGDSAASDHANPTTTTATSANGLIVPSADGNLCDFDVLGNYTYREETTGGSPYSISIHVVDAGGKTVDLSGGSATIADAALNTLSGSTFQTVEGIDNGNQLLGTFHDADPFCNRADYSLSINWNDGSPVQAIAADTTGAVVAMGGTSCDFAVYGRHVYTEAGGFSPTITVTDNAASTVIAMLVNVKDANITSLGNGLGGTTLGGVVENTAFTGNLLGTFHDAVGDGDVANCVAADWTLNTVSINWGDGSPLDQATGITQVPGTCNFQVFGGHTYAAAKKYNIQITVTDPAAPGVISATTTWTSFVTVADAAIDSTGLTQPGPLKVSEGQPFTHMALAVFHDSDPACKVDDLTAQVAWGDGGTSSIVPGADLTGGLGTGCLFTVAGGHTYTSEGSFPITITLKDAEGSVATVAQTVVANITDAAIYAIDENQSLSAIESKPSGKMYLGEFHDTDPNCNVQDFSAVVNWDKGGTDSTTNLSWLKHEIVGPVDGLCDFNVYGTFTYTEEGKFPIEVTVQDDGGAAPIVLNDVMDVADASLDSKSLLQPIPAIEGVSLSKVVLGTVTDHDPNCDPALYSVSINWGDGTATDSSTGTVVQHAAPNSCVFDVVGTHMFAEENQHPYPIGVTINDHGASATLVDGAQVADAALTSTATAVPALTTEGQPFKDELIGTMTDAYAAGCALDDYSVAIRWNDSPYVDNSTGYLVKTGSSPAGCTYNVFGNHTFLEEGLNSAIATITDKGGSVTSFTTSFNTVDAALTWAAADVKPVEGKAFTDLLLGKVTDADPGCDLADLKIVSIDWGDGTGTDTTSGKIVREGTSCVFDILGSHMYTEEGNQTISLTVVDVGGASTGLSTVVAKVQDAVITPTLQPNFTATEGLKLTNKFLGSFVDAAGVGPDPSHPICNAADMSGTINWGDHIGTAGVATIIPNPSVACGFNVYGTYTYLEEGKYPVTVSLKDAGSSTATIAELATVGDALLKGQSNLVSNSCTLLVSCTTAKPVATIVDTNTLCNTEPTAISSYVASIDWGDGLKSAGVIKQRGTSCVFDVTGTHTYTSPGTYTIKTNFADDGGASFLTSAATDSVNTLTVGVPDSTLPRGTNPGAAPAQMIISYGHMVTDPKKAYAINAQLFQYRNKTTFTGNFNFVDMTKGQSIPACMISTGTAACHLYILSFQCTQAPGATAKSGKVWAKYVINGLARYFKVDLNDPDPSTADSILLTFGSGPNANTAVTSSPPTPPTNALGITC